MSVTLKCERCQSELILGNEGLVNLVCPLSGCKGKKIVFDKDIERCPYKTNGWETVLANTPVDSGYSMGTVTSYIYEFKVLETEAKEPPPSVTQFVEAEKEEDGIEEIKVASGEKKRRIKRFSS